MEGGAIGEGGGGDLSHSQLPVCLSPADCEDVVKLSEDFMINGADLHKGRGRLNPPL